jgi:hypothetical protein
MCGKLSLGLVLVLSILLALIYCAKSEYDLFADSSSSESVTSMNYLENIIGRCADC